MSLGDRLRGFDTGIVVWVEGGGRLKVEGGGVGVGVGVMVGWVGEERERERSFCHSHGS